MKYVRYALALAAAAAFLLFWGEDSLVAHWQRQAEIAQLRDELRARQEVLRADSRTLLRLGEDSREAERVARERYLMKRPGEDVYVFE